MSSYEGFRFGKVGDFFSSQDIYMYMSGQEVQFRTFSGDSAWQGEIKGASAAGGKIGGGNVNFYCMKHIGINIGGGKSNNWNERSILSKVDVERIYELYTKFYNQQNTFQKQTILLCLNQSLLKHLIHKLITLKHFQSICVCYF